MSDKLIKEIDIDFLKMLKNRDFQNLKKAREIEMTPEMEKQFLENLSKMSETLIKKFKEGILNEDQINSFGRDFLSLYVSHEGSLPNFKNQSNELIDQEINKRITEHLSTKSNKKNTNFKLLTAEQLKEKIKEKIKEIPSKEISQKIDFPKNKL